MRKINEIFYSLQGEGFRTGIPSVFIRFCGCNLKCSFCDTAHESGIIMTDDEILSDLSSYPCRNVVLTGGEPSLWIDYDFVEKLHIAGFYVCIETNGTRRIPSNIDWITCSPKEGSKIVLYNVNEVKVVYTGQDVEKYRNISAEHYFLQPCSCANTAEVVDYIKSHPHWRLSLQIHKMIDIR